MYYCVVEYQLLAEEFSECFFVGGGGGETFRKSMFKNKFSNSSGAQITVQIGIKYLQMTVTVCGS